MEVPRPAKWAISCLRRTAEDLASRLSPGTKLEGAELVNQFPQRKRKAYWKAWHSLQESPLSGRDSHVTAFIKAEKKEILGKDPDPRMIQFRSMRFNLALGAYTRPLEKLLYQLKDRFGLRYFAKGLNWRQRAEALKTCWDRYTNPRALSLDLSRWDAHCSEELLKVGHYFTTLLFPDPELKELLRCQLRNRGSSRAGMRYKCPGGVMSGDMTTAYGNCVLVLLIIKTMLRQLGPRLKSYVSAQIDGDDYVLIGEEEDIKVVSEYISQWFLACGHELKVEGFTDKFENIVFCQSKPLYHHGMWDMVADPLKTIQRSLCIPGGFCRTQEAARAYLGEICYMRAILHQGQPVLGPLFHRLSHQFPRTTKLADTYWNVKMDVFKSFDARQKIYIRDVEPESRLMFEQSWGLSPQQQAEYEALQVPALKHVPTAFHLMQVESKPEGIVLEHPVDLPKTPGIQIAGPGNPWKTLDV